MRQRGAGVQCEPGSHPGLPDGHELALRVPRRFRVQREDGGAGVCERRDELLRLDHHQVHVDRQRGDAPYRGDHAGPERQVGHEAAVHDVDVDEVGAPLRHQRHLLGESSEVGAENAGRDAQVAHCSDSPRARRTFTWVPGAISVPAAGVWKKISPGSTLKFRW